MTLPTITPERAKRLIEDGAVLIDIREADERARERIPGAHHLALSRLDDADLAVHRGKPVIFHCRTAALAPVPRAMPGASPAASPAAATPTWSKEDWTPGARPACRS